jgi:hypothetical protein
MPSSTAAIELIEAESPECGELDVGGVRTGADLKPSRATVEYVSDELPDAVRIMIDLASK